MDTRASTRTRLSVVPVLFALLLNMMVPVITAAVPSALPEPLQPAVVEAADDPEHVTFTLQGCRNPSVDLEQTNFVCADADYTTGNLGKTWNELDLVPHRLTTQLGTQSSATESYTIGIAADWIEAGEFGYDVVGIPVVNAGKSHASCSVSVDPGASNPKGAEIDPGIGGTDKSLGRLLTITQAKGSTCVFDWTQRLALGSHNFPGSSLHTNRTNQLWSTSGIGAADVSIPVKEILPQELSKDMSAERGRAYAWSIDKSAEPASLSFANTCLTTPGARSQDVDITITWTRSGPNASGDTTITTHVYATNPAHRSILVSVIDRIYEGAGQTTLLDTASNGPVSVPAGTEDALILTHSFVYSGAATSFNDVATATYLDEDLGIAVPGQTTATASATTQASNAPAVNSSVVVSDTESISGSGLSFSVAAPSVGAFSNYTADAETTGPVEWSYTATDSGSVTFTKTVYVDGPQVTSGTLSDTATITGDGQVVLGSDSASVAIETDALVSLAINKTIPAGSLRSGESVTFDFDIAGPDSFADTASITFNYGDPLTKSTSLSDLAPGEYTVSEQPQANWADHTPQTDTITLPDCEGSVSFNNSTLAPDLSITKEADDDPVDAGDEIGFSIVVSNDDVAGTGVAKDVELNDPLPGSTALGVSWELEAVLINGTAVNDPSAYCDITGTVPSQTLECAFGDVDPGDSAEVQISSHTAAKDGCTTTTLRNTARADASNHDAITAFDSVTIECPDLDINKTADHGTVSAGSDLGFTITVTNDDADGVGTADDVTIDDPLPGSLALGVDWSVEAVWLNGSEVGDPGEYCEVTGDAPDQTLECELGDLEPGDSAAVHVTSATSGDGECSTADLENEATADADNHAEITAEASTVVECPGLNLLKEADADPIDAGEEASFTITVWNAGPGDAFDVELKDELPAGLAWDFDVVQGDADCDIASSLVNGGVEHMSIDCDLGTLEPSEMKDGVIIRVFAETDLADCGVLENTAFADASNDDEVSSSDEIEVNCPAPTLVIDKVASAETIVISGEAGDLEATPSVVTWTLTYTLTNGPVTNAMITDEIPTGFVFLDAADGGTFADGTVTWTFPTLTESGSVTFRTTVDPETISRTAPTVNVAVIDSDETEPDEGEDDVKVTVEPPVLGGNPTPTPKPSLPDTAAGIGIGGQPVSVPVELLAVLFLASLGTLALANVRARNGRR